MAQNFLRHFHFRAFFPVRRGISLRITQKPVATTRQSLLAAHRKPL
jgi:hypothetical protein